MSVLARLIVGRIVNKAGMQSDEDRRTAADEEFWSTLRASVAEHAADVDVQQANMEAQEVTKDTMRRLARGEIQ